MGWGVAEAWALVSEPGFLGFQISRFSSIEIFIFREIILGNLVVRYRGKNSKRCSGETLDKTDGFESHFQYIEIPIFPKVMNIDLPDVW